MYVYMVMGFIKQEFYLKSIKVFALSENMQRIEGSQPNQSYESPDKEPTGLEEQPSHNSNNPKLEGYEGCDPNPNDSNFSSTHATSSSPQQPETLNLPAVLWDKPAGSKIRVPPPVPPRSPRKPIDPVSSGAFEAAMATPYGEAPSQVNIAPQRGLPLGIVLNFVAML